MKVIIVAAQGISLKSPELKLKAGINEVDLSTKELEVLEDTVKTFPYLKRLTRRPGGFSITVQEEKEDPLKELKERYEKVVGKKPGNRSEKTMLKDIEKVVSDEE